MSIHRWAWRGWLALLLITLSPPMLRAQEPTPAGQPPQAADTKPAETKPAETKSSAAVDREQTIYIPYTRLREVFEKEGRGVFLPYDKFQALWKAAKEKHAAEPEKRPPVNALVTEIDSEATVGKDVVRVTAKLKIEILAEGWNDVPLGLADAAILSAKLGDEAARLAFDPNTGYRLLVEKPGKDAAQLVLTLEYAKAFTKAPGQNSVAFQAPQAPVNRWKIRIPEAGVKVNIHPLIAATEVPEAAEVKKPDDKAPDDKQPEKAPEKKGAETIVMAFVGASPTVRIDWTPKAEGATGLAALATVQSQQEVTIDEGVLRTRTRLTYDITRAELSLLEIEAPADHKVVNVFDPNVRQWEVKAGEAAQTISVQLFEPTRGTQNIVVELEKFNEDRKQQELTVPVIKAKNVGRQQGVVVVRLSSGLRSEVIDRTGLLQLDAAELPKNLAGTPWAYSYRYAALPFELKLSIEKVQPRIQAEELVEAYLEPEQFTLDLFALYTIERAGVFQLDLDIPAGYEIRQVRGQACSGAEPAAVDAWHVQGDDKTRLAVNLSRKALGRVGLFVELVKRLNDPNLLSPTGNTSQIALPVPRVATAGIERRSGRIIVFAPESLRVNPSEQQGLRGISFSEAYQGVESTRGGRFVNLREVLAFAFTSEAASATLSVERRKPQITVGQLLVAQIEAGVVKYEARFFYDIRYSGVKSLRIDVPAALAPDIRNQTAGVREQVIEPAPEGLADGYVAWSLAGETEFLGNVVVRLTWERKIDKLEIGKSVDLDVPVLKPAGVDRAWGQIVLSKSETIDVQPSGEPKGLRPIDPQHDLMPGASVANAARAMEFHADWSLTVTATRYKLEEVKRTSIERAVVRIVATRSDQLAVQAMYRLRSAAQRLAVRLPEGAQFDTQPLRINGKPASLERGDKDEMFIPLVGQNPDESFLLELRYTLAGSTARLDIPEFPGDATNSANGGAGGLDRPAVQKVYVCVYLPEERALLGRKGPWADEINWQPGGGFSQIPYPQKTDQELIAWVQEGVNLSGGSDTFQTDGRMVLFSTLRPEPPPEGSLQVVTMNENAFKAWVFIAVAVLGLVLLRRTLLAKIAAVALLVIGLVLLGAFLPIFSRQLLGGVLLTAVFLVLIAWLVWHLVLLKPKWLSLSGSSSPVFVPATAAVGASPFVKSDAPPADAPADGVAPVDVAPVAEPPAEPPPQSPADGPPPGASPDENKPQGGEHHG